MPSARAHSAIFAGDRLRGIGKIGIPSEKSLDGSNRELYHLIARFDIVALVLSRLLIIVSLVASPCTSGLSRFSAKSRSGAAFRRGQPHRTFLNPPPVRR